jgi:TetR/AcrR family transcriptional regulator, regulator of biofilm formation and stress response
MTNNGDQGSRQLSTRKRIVHATVELMAEHGIDRVRTRAVGERAGVNPALVHYHFGSMSALLLEAAEDALIRELGPSVDLLTSAPTIQEGITAALDWIEAEGQRTPGSTILAEAMVKATRDPAFRRWTRQASRRWRTAILERLRRALADGEIEATLDLDATAVLLAAALDGLLFHRLVNGKLDVKQTIAPIEAMLRPSRQVEAKGDHDSSLRGGKSRNERGAR